MKIRMLLVCAVSFFTFVSCDVAQQAQSAYNMVNCNYEYKSISGLSFAGMNLSNGLSLTNALQAASLLSGNSSSLPVQLTLNLDVTNPNKSVAALSGMQYVLSIDDVEFTTGSLSQSLNINAGKTETLPLSIGFDLASLLGGESKDAVTNIAKNFLGIGDAKSNVTLQVRPSFNVNGYTVTSPVYIPISFSFGG